MLFDHRTPSKVSAGLLAETDTWQENAEGGDQPRQSDDKGGGGLPIRERGSVTTAVWFQRKEREAQHWVQKRPNAQRHT